MSTLDIVPSPRASVRSGPPSRESSQPPGTGPNVPPSNAEDVQTSAPSDALAAQDPPQSQPMTASASNSSLNAANETGDDSAITYGTRSRNRTGHRPNYADDKELDLEIEQAGRIKPASKKSAPASTNNLAPTQTNPSFAVVNGGGLDDEHAPSPAPAPAAQPAPAPSKKRKAPGSNPVAPIAAPPPSAYTLDTRTRFSGPASYVETNMMSFSRSGSKLNAKGQLVADDGTALVVDGE